ncbi:MAG: SAM-dependent methyltransferase [Saprospiraceae bacterium]|nr:SAM-dependent methyltransferase [Saprospiraceae bacterium]
MQTTLFPVEAMTPFSESLIWQINRDYYSQAGMDAWTSGLVPHHMTSNAMVGKTYAGLIMGLLTDLSLQGKTLEAVQIVELGAGHGRLCFHILRYLDEMMDQSGHTLPPYRYILSDIATKNLDFFIAHAQFKPYFESGKLDVAYVDAIETTEIKLLISGEVIGAHTLQQPLVIVANYFFDSIPQHLFYLKAGELALCSLALDADVDPASVAATELLPQLKLRYDTSTVSLPFFHETVADQILENYGENLKESCLLFPHAGMSCIERMRHLSLAGAMVLTMDKGSHLEVELDNRPLPDYVTHGSFSLNVNYHALGRYADLTGGRALFPATSNFNLELGCLLWLDTEQTWKETVGAYARLVDDYGPDDFFSLARMVYPLADKLTIQDMIALLRLSAYDSTFFYNLLPWFKQVVKKVTYPERSRIAETMDGIWKMYFSIRDTYDLAFEMAGIFYDLGYFEKALAYFDHSEMSYGASEDGRYNKALCLYQMKRDVEFLELIRETSTTYPQFTRVKELGTLKL